MKSFYKFLLIFFITLNISAQNFTKEHQNIKNVTLGYIENFFENNTKEMLSYLHPKLAKRGFSKKRGEQSLYFENLSKERLVKMLKKKKRLPRNQQKNTVKILDVFYNTASVRLTTGYPGKMRWIEYIHLCKTDNKWQIVNIIWDYFPRIKRN